MNRSIRYTFIPQAIALFLTEPNLMLQKTRRPDKVWKIYLKPEYRNSIIQKMNANKKMNILTPILRAILSVFSAVYAPFIILVDLIMFANSVVIRKKNSNKKL